MNTNKNKPWNENWKIIKQIGSGGQGQTFLVKPRKDVFLSNQYVLKKLIKQDDNERRGRMYREVAALETLNHSGIPKIFDSNSELFDSDTPLYMVTEFVPGATLSEVIKEKTMSIQDAVNFVIKLLDIVEYCHQKEIVHRDIKPGNIMVKNNDINNPVLIDFGLSFNKVDDFATSLTLTGQQLGNRFLSLPELLEKSSLQRDFRSDITQICGILFFVITGKNPTTFLDSDGKKPHQRPEIKQTLSVLSESILTKTNRIFDRAFDIKIDYRWQSIPALKEALIDILESENQKDNKIETIRERIRNKQLAVNYHSEHRELFHTLIKQTVEQISYIVQDVVKELGSDFKIRPGTAAYTKSYYELINWENFKLSTLHLMSVEFNKLVTKRFMPSFEAYITGNEFIFVSKFKEKEIDLLRTSFNDEPDFTGFTERIKKFYYEGIESIIPYYESTTTNYQQQ